ncbi:MAG: ergothioneine biosynthesis protein EgtB [Acidobacteriaceae bacterium]
MSTATQITATDTALSGEFVRVRHATEQLARPLNAEDMMLQSMPDASPAKWHLAHTTWFFETFILRQHLRGYRVFNDDFLRVFNSYYKQVGDHPNRAMRGLFSRPTLDEVVAYRQHVERGMAQLLQGEASAAAESLLTLGMNHEQQHQELMVTDIKHAFWSQPLQPAYHHQPRSRNKEQAIAASPGDCKWIPFRGGIHGIGFSGDGFCFDNETPQHQTLLRPFRLASRLVTNAEYLEFIRSGAYSEPSLWLSEGWDTIVREQWHAPLYWERDQADGWRVFTLHGWQPLDLAAPTCHISYFEADAFARWSGARLPLESEWEIAARERAVPIAGNFSESGLLHPRASGQGGALQQMYGDVWEWTASPYTAYPGFVQAAGAIGEYNGKFMCNQYVLRGGSCATPQSHIRASYRNFFPAHARWQFSGIRLASDGDTVRRNNDDER